MTYAATASQVLAREMALNLPTVKNNTIKHAITIANRLGCSEGMAMAKSLLIDQLRTKLRQGTAHFWYVKMNECVDGLCSPEVREAWGTQAPNLMNKKVFGDGREGERTNTVRYWDVEKGGFRSLRIENLLRVE